MNDVAAGAFAARVEYALSEFKKFQKFQTNAVHPPVRSISTAELTVINAAKAWYRGIVRGEAREKKRKEIISKLPAPERRLAQMVANMLEAEGRR